MYAGSREGSDDLIHATLALAAALGIENPTVELDEESSRFWKARKKLEKALDTEVAQKAQHGLETRLLGLPEAQMTEALARATKELAESVRDQEYAVARAGQVMLVKHPYRGRSLIMTRTLSLGEMAVIDRFPEIEKYPEHVLAALASAVAMDPATVTIDMLLPREAQP